MFLSLNPATEELIEEHRALSDGEIKLLLDKADTAFRSWRELTLPKRLTYVEKLKNILIERKNYLAELVTEEMGRVISETLKEVERLCVFCDFAIEESERILAPRAIVKSHATAHIITEPLGVVLSITPWNVPLATPFRSALPAIVCGNAVLCKPAPNAIRSAKALEKVFLEAGFPEFVFSVVLAKNESVEHIVSSSIVKKVSFVGSSSIGSHIATLAAKNIKPVVLELGGNDPCIVLESAQVEEAAKIAVDARCANAGQICCASKRLLVHEHIYAEFTEALAKQFFEKKIGNPMETTSQIGPLAKKDLKEKLEVQVSQMRKDGAIQLNQDGKIPDKGFYFSPILFGLKCFTSHVQNEELFGPVMSAMKFRTIDQAIQIANSTDYGLGATVLLDPEFKYGQKPGGILDSDINHLIQKLECGFIHFNRVPTVHPYIPVGGVKRSGYGKDCGEEGYHEFINKKSIVF